MGRLARITIAYDILSKTRKTKIRPLRSSGNRIGPSARAAPALAVSSDCMPGGEGTTGLGLVSPQLPNDRPQLLGQMPFHQAFSVRSASADSAWPDDVTSCPRR